MSWLSSKIDDLCAIFVCKHDNLVALGPNLYHGCILGVSWLSSNIDDRDLFFEVIGVDFNMQICNFRL